MKLSTCILRYFDEYLPRIKGATNRTIKTYRDAFALFLPFAAQYHTIKVNSLTLDHISQDLILSFLDHLEISRNNMTRTRNQRLATLKSMAKMIRLLYPEHKKIADQILNIPQKRAQKNLIAFLTQEEILNTLEGIDLEKKEGFRDYTIINLLSDSGARASELSTLNIEFFDPQNKCLAILGKANRWRQVVLFPRTTSLLETYIKSYRPIPKPLYRQRIFINRRGEEITRHGIYRLCQKHLAKVLLPKRLKEINPVHSFRHACAVNMLVSGSSITDIKNHLGHESIDSTMIYLNLNLTRKREVQKKFIQYTQAILPDDPKLDELVDWENKGEILTWLDSL